MENSNLSGHWEGRFTSSEAAGQETFTEKAAFKYWWARPLASGYLKRQQGYLNDLAKMLAGC